MAHEVFVSYSHIDNQITFALCDKLEADGAKCWIAPRDIKPGKTWAGEIAAAIPNSKVFIIILSSSSNLSEQVLREVEIAVHNKLIIVPVRIEDVMPTGGMSYYLATMQWIDVKGDKIDHKISMISKKIRNILADLENTEEARQEKIELAEKQRGERELKAKEIAEAKTAEKLFQLQEKEKLELQQLESKENQRIARESHAKARAAKKIADKMHKLDEKEKLLQKQRELSENERQLKQAKIVKRKNPADSKQSATINPPAKKKISKKNLIIIVASAVLAIAAGVVLLVLRDEIFGSGDNKFAESATLEIAEPTPTAVPTPEAAPTPEATPTPEAAAPTDTAAPTDASQTGLYTPEHFGLNPDYVVEIPDRTLNIAIVRTLTEQGEVVSGSITIADMFKLKNLIIVWVGIKADVYYAKEIEKIIPGAYIYSYGWGSGVNNQEGLEYAKNLESLILDDWSMKNLEIIEEQSQLKHIYFINAYVLEDISALVNVKSELITLSLSGCGNIPDFSIIRELTNLEFLSLNRTGFSEVKLLEGMANLKTLKLGGNNYVRFDIQKLAEYPLKYTLEELYLYEDVFDNLDVLLQFINMKVLYLSNDLYDNNIDTVNELKAVGCSVYRGTTLME